jgi:septal ring-binding cell division protein DamX
MQRLLSITSALTIALALASPGAAQDQRVQQGEANHLLAGHTYDIALGVAQGAEPACRETWSFENAGDLTVASGEEIVSFDYQLRPIPRDSMHELTLTRLATNGRSDCQGQVSAPVTTPESRRVNLQFLNNGGFFVCANTDGMSCYGVASPRP